MLDGNNITFRSNSSVDYPLKVIEASLDISGKIEPGTTFYFNHDNTLDYMKTPRDYYDFIQITKDVFIDEVQVYTEPVVQFDDPNVSTVNFNIGGAKDVRSPPRILYASPSSYASQFPPNYSGRYLTTSEINSNPIGYFGHSGAKFPYGKNFNRYNFSGLDPPFDDPYDQYKYLAMSIYPVDSSGNLITWPINITGTVHIVLKTYAE